MKTQGVTFYELEKIRFIIKDACDLDISYAYEDLVFSEHGLFIIQSIQDNPSVLNVWFNKDCTEAFNDSTFRSLVATCAVNKMNINLKGTYILKQKKNSDEIDIKFITNTTA
jgi:hypothetical protein